MIFKAKQEKIKEAALGQSESWLVVVTLPDYHRILSFLGGSSRKMIPKRNDRV